MMSNTSSKSRIALFAGSFNPFTRGHQRIVERALPLFDQIVIGVGCNMNKAHEHIDEIERRVTAIKTLFAEEKKVVVASYQCLTADYAKQVGACYLLRGVRTMSDFDVERTIADVNRMLTGIETILLMAEPEMVHISSSVVHELQSYGKDVSALLPKMPKKP